MQIGGSIVFARILPEGTLVQPGKYDSTQVANRSVQPFSHRSRQSVTIFFTTGCPFTFKITPPHGGSGPSSNAIPWAHPSPQPKWHLDRFSRFCTNVRRVSVYFTMGRLFPLRIAPSHGGSGPHLTWFLGAIQVLKTNGISISSAVSAGLTGMIDRHHTTWSVTIGRIYVRSTAMRPNNTHFTSLTGTTVMHQFTAYT